MSSARPSSSGGPSRRGGNHHFDNRMSKDDLFLRSRPARTAMASNGRISRDDSYIGERTHALDRFHDVPGAGLALPPSHTPTRDTWLSGRGLATPMSTTSGDIPIGMALGSPVFLQVDVPRSQAQSPSSSTDAASILSPPANVPAGSLQRKKTGKRKLFGLFGGGKKNAVEEGGQGGLTVLSKGSGASTSTTTTSTALATTNTLKKKTTKTPTRSHTQTAKGTAKSRGLLSRSNTLPPKRLDEPRAVPMDTEFQRRQALENAALAIPTIAPLPRLEVSIPDTKMERYSVMFSDVLKENKKEPASSLLARRQAHLQRLHALNDNSDRLSLEPVLEDDRTRPRRATSPHSETFTSSAPVLHPAPPRHSPLRHSPPRHSPPRHSPPRSSPRLIVFPPESLSAPPTHSRAARSNTSPGRMPSPTHSAVDRRLKSPASKGAPSLGILNPFSMHPPEAARPTSKPQEPIYPTDTSFHFGPEKSGRGLDSPDSVVSHGEIIIAQMVKPTLHQPMWEMVSPGPNAAASSIRSASSSSCRLARSPSSASSNTHATKPSSEFDPADDPSLQNAVEISIARQISISRQQRNLLRPLNTRRPSEKRKALPSSAAPAMSEARSPLGVTVIKSPNPDRLGRNEPIKETKCSTPTLVHRRESPVDPQNRKSSWVVLESD